MDAFLAERGLALLAVVICLLLSVAVAPVFLLFAAAEYSPSALLSTAGLALALLAVAGAWWVVGSPGDWSLVFRAVVAAIILFALFLIVYVLLEGVWWRLGDLGRRIWRPAVIVGAGVVAVGGWYAIAVWLPLPLAIALAVIVMAPIVWALSHPT